MASDFIGPPVAPTNYSGFGYALAVAGAASSAVGSYFSVLGERNKLRSAALSAEFEGSVAAIDARQAESDAQLAGIAGQEAIGRVTLLAGEQRAAARAGAAGRGVAVGSASAAEVQASIDLGAAIDSYTIRRNTAREVANARTQATNLRGRAVLARASARSLRAYEGALSPFTSVAASLLSSGAQIGSTWLLGRRPTPTDATS